jgi:hypothetical protein
LTDCNEDITINYSNALEKKPNSNEYFEFDMKKVEFFNEVTEDYAQFSFNGN